MINRYDPDHAPGPQEWLELDEQIRLRLIREYHQKTGAKLPNLELHAAIHSIVENQLALEVPSVVHAMERLSREGLSRHNALHAIGSVLAEHIFHVLKAEGSQDLTQADYDAALDQLNAKDWLGS